MRLTRLPRALILALLLALVSASLTLGQTTEEHEITKLSAEELGPYEPTSRPDLESIQKTIVERTNAFRRRKDLGSLERNEHLDEAAQAFADYMARTDRYGHGADDKTAGQRARDHGYDYCLIGENIQFQFQTQGFTTGELAKRAFKGWKQSPGHRRNMLKPHATETGVGAAQSDSTGAYYLVQLVGRPRSAAIAFEIRNRTDEVVEYQLGKRSFELPPNYTRWHEVCVPRRVKFAGEDAPAPQKPQDGQRLVLSSDGGQLELRVENGERIRP